MRVTVKDLSSAARAGLAAVTAETAGYFVLGAADQLAASTGRLGAVVVGEDGSVLVERLGEGSAADLEADLRALLAQLLGLSPVRVPALQRAADGKEARGLFRLSGEIEAALIPVNRAAARRALSRLHRDVVRAKASGRLPEQPVAEPVREIASPPLVQAHATDQPVVRPLEPTTLTPIVPEVAAFERPQHVPERASEPWVARSVDATPFLGTWTPVAPRVPSPLVVVAPTEHDTDPAAPVGFEATPAHDLRSGAAQVEMVAESAPVLATPDCSPLIAGGAMSADPGIAHTCPANAPAVPDTKVEDAVVAGVSAPTFLEVSVAAPDEPCTAYLPRKSDVAALVAGFEVAESRTLLELSRELKRMADVGVTPEPPSSLPSVAGATLRR